MEMGEIILQQTIATAVIFAVIGFVVSAGVCYALLRFWPKGAGWDSGDLFRKSQQKPVLRLGGVAILAGLLVFSVASIISYDHIGSRVGEPWKIILVCLLFFGIGVFDDLFQVSAMVKLVAQIAVATFAYNLGIRIELLSEPFGGTSTQLLGLSFPVTVLWLIAIPNLINLVDGMDGLAGGVGISLAGTLAVVSWMSGDLFMMALCLGMVGSIAGFLLFNLPRARIYLGDGGAYLLGAFIATTSASASQKGAVAGALFVVVLALALPIADTVFAILRRAFYGLPVWRADSEHIHHRLVTLGFRKGMVIGGMIAVVLISSLLGLSLVMDKGESWPVVLTITVIAGLFLIRILGYWGSFGAFRQHIRRILTTRERVRYAYSLGTVLEHEIDRAPSADQFWGDFRRSMEKVGLFPQSLVQEKTGAQGDGDTESGDSEAFECLDINMTNGQLWKLQHRPGTAEMHWGKVAACFLGPLSRGISKWGHIPRDLGMDHAIDSEVINIPKSTSIKNVSESGEFKAI